MLRSFKNLVWVALLSLSVSCSSDSQAELNATIADAASSEIVLKRLDLDQLTVLDTVEVDASGKFSYSLNVKEGDPDIVYVFYKEKKIASLIIQQDEEVGLVSDTLGNYTVTGSPESEKMIQVEKDYSVASYEMTQLYDKMNQTQDAALIAEYQNDLGRLYIDYYRSRIRYVMENPASLSSFLVLYQKIGGNLQIFNQPTDAIHFRNVAEAMCKSYPDSRYARALSREAKSRMEYMQVHTKLSMASEIGFPDIVLSDITGVEHTLSKVDKKAVLVNFWTSTDVAMKMYNLEVLLPVYKEFAARGFEIYQIALDEDKRYWSSIVKAQQMPWISVCDSRGTASPYAASYNLGYLPASFLICDGELVDGNFIDAASLRQTLNRLL